MCIVIALPTPLLLFLGKLHVITEFCPGGNLRQILVNSRVESSEENLTKHNSVASTLNHRQLLKIAVDIANGMVHLSCRKVFCNPYISYAK